MQFSDFPFPDSEPNAFVGCQEMEDYLLAYVDKHQLRQYILLTTEILSVDETFKVTYRMQANAEERDSSRPNRILLELTDGIAVYAEQFDAVCVANGHYSEPSLPTEIPGFHSSKFRTIHSRAYREPDRYRDQCVVVVGASHSGLDICGELAPVAKQVMLSMKEEGMPNMEFVLNLLRHSGKRLCTDYLSSSFSIVPPIERIEDETVYFDNQTSVKPDLIIFATGYKYCMRFLEGNLQVDQTRLLNHRYVYPLFKQLFHADFSRGQLSFLAIPYRVVPFPLAELQSHLIGRVLCGNITLPSKDDMMREVDDPLLPRNRRYHCVNMIDYTKDLLKMMNDSDRHFGYRFTIDSERRIRKVVL